MKPLAILVVAFLCGMLACDSITGPSAQECRVTGSGTFWFVSPSGDSTLATYTTSWCAPPLAWACYAMLDAPGADSVRVMWQRPYNNPHLPTCRTILGIRQ